QMEASGANMQQKQMEVEMQMRMKEQEHQQGMVHAEQEHRLKMAQAQQKAQLDAHTQAQKGQMEVEKEKAKQPSVVVEGKGHSRRQEALAQAISSGHEMMAQTLDKVAGGQDKMADAIKDLAAAHRAPRKLVRDKSGRASHTETVG